MIEKTEERPAEPPRENALTQPEPVAAVAVEGRKQRTLHRMSTALLVLVAGVLTVFCFYASTICIVVVVSSFLAMLLDPLVVRLERLRVPRGLGAAAIILAGAGLLALGVYALYGNA